MSEKVERWREAYGPDEVVQRVRPEHTAELILNPHKGTATFQRFNGDPLYPDLGWDDNDGPMDFPPPANKDLSNSRYVPTTIAYCRWTWAALEPRKGEIRFDIIEKALQTAARRGQTLQMRTQPFVVDSCPQWYWDLGARTDPQASPPGRPVPDSDAPLDLVRATAEGSFPAARFVPDHNDPLYLQHWGDHIRALGERLDGHPNLESFDIAYGGGCGETGGNADCLTARKLAQVYLDSFQSTQLVGMLGTEGCAYGARQPTHDIGWRADCYGDVHTGRFDGKEGPLPVPRHLVWNHMRDAYPQALYETRLEERWKTAPVTLETCWSVAYWFQQGWDIDWILDQGCKYHLSVFMPKSVYFPDEWMDKMRAFNNRMGYWLHLLQMILPLEGKRGRKISIKATVDNKGVAPLYRPYRFALRFSQGKGHHVVKFGQDVRRWLPDLTHFEEAITVPGELQPGEAKVSCAIVDAHDKPVVRLAIRDIDGDRWHPLTSIDIL
jgi:hypothetical protein